MLHQRLYLMWPWILILSPGITLGSCGMLFCFVFVLSTYAEPYKQLFWFNCSKVNLRHWLFQKLISWVDFAARVRNTVKNMMNLKYPFKCFLPISILGPNYWNNFGKPELKKRNYVKHYGTLKKHFINKMEGLFEHHKI